MLLDLNGMKRTFKLYTVDEKTYAIFKQLDNEYGILEIWETEVKVK